MGNFFCYHNNNHKHKQTRLKRYNASNGLVNYIDLPFNTLIGNSNIDSNIDTIVYKFNNEID